MEILQGKKVTHKNKHYENGVKFHKSGDGSLEYFSYTYDRWMPCEFTPEGNLTKLGLVT